MKVDTQRSMPFYLQAVSSRKMQWKWNFQLSRTSYCWENSNKRLQCCTRTSNLSTFSVYFYNILFLDTQNQNAFHCTNIVLFICKSDNKKWFMWWYPATSLTTAFTNGHQPSNIMRNELCINRFSQQPLCFSPRSKFCVSSAFASVIYSAASVAHTVARDRHTSSPQSSSQLAQ